MSWRYGGAQLHFYCEYWDPQLDRWVPLDAGDEKPPKPPVTPQERSRTGRLGSLTFYAHPGFPTGRDSYRTSCFEDCLPVTANFFEGRDIGYAVPADFSGTATAYVWNSDAWRTIARGAAGHAGESTIQFADAPGSVNRPVLHSVTDGETMLWGLQGPTPESGRVELKPAAPGECQRWASYEGL